ncbi:MAG: orotidine-5'-phosphate decarboxylase [Candidatus Saccharibacteria bacterium]
MLTMKEARERIIVPIDTSSRLKAADLINRLSPLVGGFKIGYEAGFSFGWDVAAEMVNESGKKLMFDAKLHDIPNTLAKGVRGIVKNFDPWLITMHASATERGVQAVAEQAGYTTTCCVTVLTSIDPESDEYAQLYASPIEQQVVDMQSIASAGGARRLVCAPSELRYTVPSRITAMKYITPGVRPEWAPANDQVRMMTPMQAIAAGADYLVIGRPITQPPEDAPAINGSSEAAVTAIADEIIAGMAQRKTRFTPPPGNDV